MSGLSSERLHEPPVMAIFFIGSTDYSSPHNSTHLKSIYWLTIHISKSTQRSSTRWIEVGSCGKPVHGRMCGGGFFVRNVIAQAVLERFTQRQGVQRITQRTFDERWIAPRTRELEAF